MDIVARVEKQVAAALGRAGYSGNNSTLVVAVSGGPDSSALVYCLARLRQQHQVQLHLAHLNHDFRGEEADADARFVASTAQALGVNISIKKLDPQEYQRQRSVSSFEQAARELRYSFLADVASEVGATAVALGHTADDLAETVLMHILRGTGLHGLRGMTELSPWPVLPSPSMGEGQDGGDPSVEGPLPSIPSHKGRGRPPEGGSLQVIRPLLGVTKADTVAYCHQLGLVYREDTSNYLRRFTRNRIRHELLPLLAADYNPRVRDSLVRLAGAAAMELDFLDREVDKVWHDVATQYDAESVSFDRGRLGALHALLQRLCLRRGYVALAGDSRRLEETHLNAMSEMVTAPSGRRLDLPRGLRLHSLYHQLVLRRGDTVPCPFPPLEGEHSIVLPAGKEQEAVTDIPGWQVTVRTVVPAGDLPIFASPLSKGVDPPVSPLTKGGLEGGLTAYFERRSLSHRLSIRTRQPGDRFQPLGLTQQKKLQDFFTDAQVPRAWRDRVPLLVSDRSIAWVVGYRIAEWAKLVPGDPLDRSALTACVTISLLA